MNEHNKPLFRVPPCWIV